MLADWSIRASHLHATTNQHGFADLTAFIALSFREAARWYTSAAVPYVALMAGAQTVWDGRLEDVKLTTGGIMISALGYARALSDQQCIAIWSTTDISPWRPLTASEVATAASDLYTTDTQNRLFITATKNATLGGAPGPVGYLGFPGVAGGRRQLSYISCSYELTAPINFEVGLRRCDSTWNVLSTFWSQAGNVANTVQSGTLVGAISGCDRLAFYLTCTDTSTSINSFDTGAIYLKITNLRLTTAGSTVMADAIASDLLTLAPALNTTTALIQSPGLDLPNEIYQDMLPADILDHLVALGDSQTPPRRWEWGVYDNQRLCFRPRASAGRDWSVDVATLDVERTIDTLHNSVYATYQDASGYTLRTPVNSDTVSLAQAGLKRQTVVATQTSSATLAQTERDTALNDGKQPPPRASLSFTALYDAGGARWPVWACRAGDTATIRNLPPTLGGAIDRIRTFVVSGTDYDADTNQLTAVPELPLNTLDVLVARLAAGVKP